MNAAQIVSDAALTPGILDDYSLEITVKDAPSLGDAARLLKPGTQVSVTFLPKESYQDRIDAVARVLDFGLVPMAHLSARRIESARELEAYLDAIAQLGGAERVFVVAGDPSSALGPYEDALALIQSGLLEKYGVQHVGIAGYPEGHPDISEVQLWQAMRDKYAALNERNMGCSIITQFGFDADPVLPWIAQVRREGIEAPVRLGVSGPATMKTLVRFAARCGVGASTKVLSKYGLSLTKLLGTTGPDRLIADYRAQLDRAVHGDVRLHFYPFGGIERVAEWIDAFGRSQTHSI